MKDLGELYDFLKVHETHCLVGLFLSKFKYVFDIFRKFHMHTRKPTHIFSPTRPTVSLSDGKLLVEPIEYRSMVGSLQCLTMI